jgi:ribose transport system permease protein
MENLENKIKIGLQKLRERQWALFDDQWILLILCALIVFFSILTRKGSFLSFRNLQNISLDATIILIIGSGMTFLLIAKGLDLSTGSQAIFASIVTGKTMSGVINMGQGLGTAIFCGVFLGFMSGVMWGFVNGCLVVKTKIPPFIATLGTQGAILGLAQVWTGGINVQNIPPQFQASFGLGKFGGLLPYPVLVAFIIASVFWVILRCTRFGMRTYAIGANLEGARRAGIDVAKHRMLLYILVGLLCGIVGIIDVARYNTASVASHVNTPLNAVSAVLIGGASMYGGRGRLSGTIIGAFIPAVLTNGFVVLGINPFWQNVAVGVVLLVAVQIDQIRRSQGK